MVNETTKSRYSCHTPFLYSGFKKNRQKPIIFFSFLHSASSVFLGTSTTRKTTTTKGKKYCQSFLTIPIRPDRLMMWRHSKNTLFTKSCMEYHWRGGINARAHSLYYSYTHVHWATYTVKNTQHNLSDAFVRRGFCTRKLLKPITFASIDYHHIIYRYILTISSRCPRRCCCRFGSNIGHFFFVLVDAVGLFDCCRVWVVARCNLTMPPAFGSAAFGFHFVE